MEKAKKFLPIILGGIVALLVFIVSKRIKKSNDTTSDRSNILEKAREAKLVKSILKKSEDDTESIAS